MIRKIITVLGTVGILVGGVALVTLMGSLRPKIEPNEIELAPPAVFYSVAHSAPARLVVTAQGEVKPRTDINLTAEVSGRIVKTSKEFVVGGAFEEGDLLVKIEDADYRVAVTGAKARVAQAEESLKREEAESALARKDYDALGRSGDPSALTLRKPQLAQARAMSDAAKADYDAALLNLKRTEIRAPFKGRVRERIAGEGQFISPGAAIGRIFSTDIAEIALPMTDLDLARLSVPLAFVETEENPGPGVTLSAVVAGEEHHWQARIARTEGAIDPRTRQVDVIAVVDDPYGAGSDNGAPLAIGLFVNARIEGKMIENAITLPRAALYGRHTVYVINDDDTITEKKVAVVSSDRDTITIAGGVADGARVIASPLRGAKDGDKVTPTERTAIPGATRTSDKEDKTVAAAMNESDGQ